MIKPKYKVHLYKRDESASYKWTDSFVDISDSIEMTNSSGIETRKDTFSFRVMNRKNKNTKKYQHSIGKAIDSENSFRKRDNIKIYMWNGDTPDYLPDYLEMDGLITDMDYNSDANDMLFTVDGANRSEVLLSNMVPTIVGSPGKEPSDIIIDIVQKVNQLDDSKRLVAAKVGDPIFAYDNRNRYIQIGVGSIQNAHNDSTAFEKVNYSQNWKNAFEQIEEISGPEYTDPAGSFTNEGKYIMDLINISYTTPEGDILNYNSVRWRSKTTSVTGSYSELSSGSDGFSEINVNYGTFDVINAVIISGGTNLVGGGILRVAYNQTSMGKLGARWKFIPLNKTFDSVYTKENEYITDADGDRFPDSYPYTTNTLFNNVTTDNNKEFNQALVDETGSQIKRKGQDIVNLLGEARFKAKITLRYGLNIRTLGELYHLEVPSMGWEGNSTNPSKVLRMVNYTHNFNSGGWTTTLFYEEDEGVISQIVN